MVLLSQNVHLPSGLSSSSERRAPIGQVVGKLAIQTACWVSPLVWLGSPGMAHVAGGVAVVAHTAGDGVTEASGVVFLFMV